MSIIRLKASLALVVFLLLTACSKTESEIRFATGPQGGSWYPVGGALKTIFEKNIPNFSIRVTPGAGIANVKAVESGKAELALANSISAVDGINGLPPFSKPVENVCNLATLYPQYFQIVTLANENINSPKDFRNKSFAGQGPGNTAEAITQHLLQVYSMSNKDLDRISYGSYTDSVTLLKDGNAQIFTLGTTIPAGAVMDLASVRDVKLMTISDDTLEQMKRINSGYQRAIIPAKTYPNQPNEIKTIGYATHIIAQCTMEDSLVYNLLEHMYNNIQDLEAISQSIKGITIEKMGSEIGVPFHIGAQKWYREKMEPKK